MSKGAEENPRQRRPRRAPEGGGLLERNALIERYQHYVEVVVGKLIRTMGLPQALREDFTSAGLLGLVEAADRFDPERGADFRAFAFFRIRGAIIDHVRSCCELSGKGYRMFKAFEAAHEAQGEQFGVAASQTKNAPGETFGHVIEYLTKSAVAYKLAALSPASLLSDSASISQSPETELLKKRRREHLLKLVTELPDKERLIIEQYYFRDRRFVEIAEQEAGLSKSWVSRLHDRALALLRERCVDEGI